MNDLNEALLANTDIELKELRLKDEPNQELPDAVRRFLARAGLSSQDLQNIGLETTDIEPLLKTYWLQYLRLSQIDNSIFKLLMLPAARTWPYSKSLLFTSPWTLRQAYMTNDFIKGIQSAALPLSMSVTYAAILMDLINQAACPQGSKVETLLLFLGVSNRNHILSRLLSSRNTAYVPSLLFGLPLVWGGVKALMGALDARPLTRERAKMAIETLQNYQPHLWQDFGRWLLPFSSLERHFNQLVRALTFDGRDIITANERYHMTIALAQRARDAKGFTQLYAMEGLADIINGIALKDFGYLNKYFARDTTAAVLFSKQQARATLRQLADDYRLESSQSSLRPLIRYVYANYLLWYIGQPAALSLRPLFWAVEGAKAYATFSIVTALVRAAVEAIQQLVKKKQCESAGNVWRLSPQGKSDCTRCADLPINYKDTFTDKTCVESYLRHPKTLDQILKTIQRFDFKDIIELNLVRHQLTNVELARVLEALANKKATFKHLDLNWQAQALNNTDAQRMIQSLPALEPKILRLRTQMIDEIMAQAIGNSSTLLAIDLANNGLTDEGLQALNGHYPSSLLVLHLSNSRLTLDKVNLTDFLQGLPELLSLNGNQIDAVHMRKLYPALSQSSLAKLTLPEITGNFNGTELLTHLPWQHLTYLSLTAGRYDAEVTDELSLAISHSKLESLFFGGIHLTIRDPEQFAQRIMRPSLNIFAVGSNNFDDSIVIPLFKHLPKTAITIMVMEAIPITDASITVLGQYLNQTQINQLVLSNLNTTPLGIKGLMKGIQQSNVKILRTKALGIDDESAAIIAHYLEASPLEALTLMTDNITDKGAMKIMASLPHNLKGFALGQHKLSDQSVAVLADKLKTAKQLVAVDLSANNITDITPLIEALPNSNLTVLNLSYNTLGDNNIEKLSKTLAQPVCKPPITLTNQAANLRQSKTKLVTLHLSNNPISSKGALALCQALQGTDIPTEFVDVVGVWHPIISAPIDFRTCQTSSASSLKAPWPYLMLHRVYQAGFRLTIESYRSLQLALTYPEPVSQALIVQDEPRAAIKLDKPSISQAAAYGALYLTVGYLVKEGIGNFTRWWQNTAPSYVSVASLETRLTELAKQSETLDKSLAQFQKYGLNKSQHDFLTYLQDNFSDSQAALTALKNKRRVSENELQALESDFTDLDYGIQELWQEWQESQKQQYNPMRFFASKPTIPTYFVPDTTRSDKAMSYSC